MIELPIVQKQETKPQRTKKPDWLRVKLPSGGNYKQVRSIVDEYKLHTICQSGHCPNMGECWGAGTATFMILGNTCTRSCSFCAVKTGRPTEFDEDSASSAVSSCEVVSEQVFAVRFVQHAFDVSQPRWEVLRDKVQEIIKN